MILNAPEHELSRSPAARLVGDLAERSGLFLTHFEHRLHLEGPEQWLAQNRPDLWGTPEWRGGRLVEHKYSHFRYDQPLGSFHPGHRAKWTTHELLHGLIGFAWRPNATSFFNALAARLSEVLPVTLYYFYDEAGLRRCRAHRGGGPLFGHFCAPCEAAASRVGPVELDPRWYREGRAFLKRELAAVARSRRLGRLIENRYFKLDLASDGLAYACAHGPRLGSETMTRFIERFHEGPATGAHESLDALEARVLEVADALEEEGEATPLKGSPERWMAMDVAWRLLLVLEECEGEAATELDRLVERLAEGDLHGVVGDYAALTEEFFLPAAEDLLAVGYPLLGGLGASVSQCAEGIQQVCPATAGLLGEDFEPQVRAFLAQDAAKRSPIARRFAAWLSGSAGDLCAYEAAVAHTAPPDAETDVLGAGEGLRPVAGLELLRVGCDVLALARGGVAEDGSRCLAIRRTSGGDVVVAEVSAGAADYLEGVGTALDETERASLRELGLLVPERWA